METLTTWHLGKKVSGCSRNGHTHTWGTQKTSERPHRGRGGGHRWPQVGNSKRWPLLHSTYVLAIRPASCRSQLCACRSGWQPTTDKHTCWTTTDEDPLQRVRPFAGLSPCQTVLRSAYTDNLQWLRVLGCAHVVVFAHLLLYLFGNPWREYDHYQWVILQ